MKTAHVHIYKYLLIILFLIQCSCEATFATNIVYENDFEDDIKGGEPNGWIVTRNMQWNPPYNPCMNGSNQAKWVINQQADGNHTVGITFKGQDCVIEAIPVGFKIPDPSNYQYDVDMIFPSQGNILSNVAFKYDGNNGWYGLKFINSDILEVQKVYQFQPYFGTVSFSPKIEPNTKRHISTVVKNNYIEVFIDGVKAFEKQDLNPILSSGTIALQASIGANGRNKLYSTDFDNIVVRDLSKPIVTEFVLDTPFFSQIDPIWKETEYDSASKWAAEANNTFGRWGCAVTSAAMTLKELGFHKSPIGQETTPETLNTYLKDPTIHGYNKWGGVVWSAFVQYARQSKEAGQTSLETPLPEFSYLPYDQEQVINGITNLHSRILKIQTGEDAYHFAVAKGYTIPSKQLILNDPLTLINSNPILSQMYPDKNVTKVAQFLPATNFDASYFWFYTDEQIRTFLKKDGQLYDPAQQYRDGLISGEDLTSPAFNTLFAGKPESGTYELFIQSDTPIITSLEMALFDKQSDSLYKDLTFVVSPGFDRIVSISYDKENIQHTQVSLKRTFETLTKTLEYLKEHQLLDSKAYRHILNQIEVARKLDSRQLSSAQSLIKVLSSFIEKQTVLSPLTKQLLLNELQGLPSSV